MKTRKVTLRRTNDYSLIFPMVPLHCDFIRGQEGGQELSRNNVIIAYRSDDGDVIIIVADVLLQTNIE